MVNLGPLARIDVPTTAWAVSTLSALALVFASAAAGCNQTEGATHTVFAGSDGAVSTTEDASAAAASDAVTAGAETQGANPTTRLPAGDPVEAVFNSTYFGRARDVIQTAQKKLRIVQFEVTAGDGPQLLLAAVIKAKQRGVDVRVLLDQEVSYNADALAQLKAAGVDAKYDSAKLRTHAKIVASEQGFVIGSTNWSSSSITKNNESNVLVRDANALTQLHSWLDKVWTDSSKNIAMPTGKSSVATLYADGGYFNVAGPLVDSATTRIILCTYGMNIDQVNAQALVTQLAEKLGKAKARGVQVRVLLDQSGDWGEAGNGINAQSRAFLAKMGLLVRSDPVTIITHAKFLVVDGAVIVGSNNWGYGGFQSYHEVGLMTKQPAVVQNFADYFDKIWAVSTVEVP